MSSHPWRCDVDPVAVDLAVEGHGPKLNHCERVRAVARLRQAGASIATASDRLRLHPRAVERYTAQARNEGILR